MSEYKNNKTFFLHRIPVEQFHKMTDEVVAIVGGYCAFIDADGEVLCCSCSEDLEKTRNGNVGAESLLSYGTCNECISFMCREAAKTMQPTVFSCVDNAIHITVSVTGAEGQFLGTLYCSGMKTDPEDVSSLGAPVCELPVTMAKAQMKVRSCENGIKYFTQVNSVHLNFASRILRLRRDYLLQQLELEQVKRDLYSYMELNRETECQIAAKQSELNDLRLRTVKAQMNPQFLFNALSIIHDISIFEGTEATPVLLDVLSTMFRKLMRKGDEIKTVADEAAYIRDYVLIMSGSAKDPPLLEIDIGTDCGGVKLPQFTVWPFVEVA